MKYVTIETNRTGYSIHQVGNTMTVGDLISALGQFDEDEKVYLSNDDGYTYGNIYWDAINENIEQEEE